MAVPPAEQQRIKPPIRRLGGNVSQSGCSLERKGSGAAGIVVTDFSQCGVGHIGPHPHPLKIGTDGPWPRQSSDHAVADELPGEPIVVNQTYPLQILEHRFDFRKLEPRLDQSAT